MAEAVAVKTKHKSNKNKKGMKEKSDGMKAKVTSYDDVSQHDIISDKCTAVISGSDHDATELGSSSISEEPESHKEEKVAEETTIIINGSTSLNTAVTETVATDGESSRTLHSDTAEASMNNVDLQVSSNHVSLPLELTDSGAQTIATAPISCTDVEMSDNYAYSVGNIQQVLPDTLHSSSVPASAPASDSGEDSRQAGSMTSLPLPAASSRQVQTSALSLGDILAESFTTTTCTSAIVSTEATVGQQCAADVSASAPQTTVGVAHRRLYPVLTLPAKTSIRDDVLRPFTDEQLHSLYYNYELEHADEFVDTFLQHVQSIGAERHTFYELLLNYYRARNHLSGAEHDIELLRQEASTSGDSCWRSVEELITQQGLCQDKARVTGEFRYNKAIFNSDASQQLSRILKKIRNHTHNDFSLYAYEAQLSRLQVESYIFTLYSENPVLQQVPPNLPVQALLAHQRDASATYQVDLLKQCISILFAFQRKPTKDTVFVADTRQWLSRMVATLLRLATIEDHLFLLGHVLRCPAGISKWASGYIQPVLPANTSEGSSTTGWGSVLLDHFITMLSLILQPIRQREELLYQLKVLLSPPAPGKNADSPWILVDSDGEEDEDPMNSWSYLQENDFVTLLNQFPLYQIFNHVFFIADRDGELTYSVHHATETGMLKMFAFVTRLIRILGCGLQTFRLARYRQLNKRIGRMIRHVVQYTCDHWTNYRAVATELPAPTLARLQVESDMVLLRAVACILSAQRLGSWQFLAELPYEAASRLAAWHLVCLMHEGCRSCLFSGATGNGSDGGGAVGGVVGNEMSELIRMELTVDQCRQKLSDTVNKQEFYDRLTMLPTSEFIFLLTTIANMVSSRPADELDFIEMVTGEIFEIAYVCSHTRELCSKPGRELLESICTRHSSVISYLIHLTAEAIDRIGMVSHFLFRGLPLCIWRPTERDLMTLQHWLINSDVGAVENQLARLIIERMNWSLDSTKSSLFHDVSLHYKTAILLMDVYGTHLSGRQVGRLFTDGQIQSPSGGKTPTSDEHTKLAQWVWSVALRLCLHHRSWPGITDTDITTDASTVRPVDGAVHESVARWLLGEQRQGLASYLAIVTSRSGHSEAEFCTDGIRCLSHLVDKSFYVPAVQCLFYVTPLFYLTPSYLTSNSQFMQTLLSTLQADWSRRGYFSYDSPRSVAQMFSAMVQTQIETAVSDGTAPRVVVVFWLEVLTKLTNWHKERDVLYVIDNAIKSSFTIPGCFQSVLSLFSDIAKSTVREKGSSLLPSLLSWFGVTSGSDKGASPLVDSCSSDIAWFAFTSLCAAETTQSDMSAELWAELQVELCRGPATMTVDQALAKAAAVLHLDVTPTAGNLAIYRWANQAVDTPVDHPILPLLWQRFMLLYLGRNTTRPGLPQRSSIGDRFFSSGWQLTLMKRMKKRLTETADHYHRLAARTGAGPVAANAQEAIRLEFNTKLDKFYRTLSYWLDEPRLHDPNLYVLALPADYQASLLVTVFQNQMDPWLDYIDMHAVRLSLETLAHQWDQRGAPAIDFGCTSHDVAARQEDAAPSTPGDRSTSGSPTMRILSRLERNSSSVLPPPELATLRAPVPEISSTLLCDQQNLLFALHSDFLSLVEHARVYGERVSKHLDLDCSFLELLPKLYINISTESTVAVPCRSTFNPTHQCKGPAVVTFRYDCKKLEDEINRRLEENRASYNQLLIESMLTPPQSLCGAAVHVENAVTRLINLCKTTSNSSTRDTAVEVGTLLFYTVTIYVSEETRFYPPTRQFFTSCIEMLGQEFIRNNPTQSQPLMQAVLQNPSLVSLLAPNFNPNSSSVELFVPMYEDLLRVPVAHVVEITFTLLTKFDVVQWLESNRPVLSLRTALIDVIFSALCLCGKEPQSPITLVFQVYRSHLQQVIRYQFPDHYGIVLRLLLKGSASEKLSVDVWQDFLMSIGASSENQPKNDEESALIISPVGSQLSCSQTKESLEWLSSYFLRLRTSSSDIASFGLYPTWSTYSKYIARLLGHLAAHLITVTAQELKSSRGKDPEHVVSELFRLITDSFAPWIQPLDNNGQMLLPWILDDDAVAMEMVSEWLGSVECLHHTFKDCLPAFSRQALGLLWTHYVTTLASKPNILDHILTVYHSRLVIMPWNSFYPDMNAIELMVKLVVDCRRTCFECLGNIFTLLPWRPIMQFYRSHEPPEIVLRLHISLFTLLVHLGSEQVIVENTSLPQLLTSNDIFTWDYIDSKCYNDVVQWFRDTCRPQCITADRTAAGAQVLHLLKLVAGFYPRPAGATQAADAELRAKRCSYVRAIVQLVCRRAHERDMKCDALAIVVNNLFTEVESVVAAIVDPAAQHTESMSLCTELLSVLNNCGPAHGDAASALLQVALHWIESSALSVLLLPLIAAACHCLASTVHMVRVVETGIETYFTLDVTQLPDAGWTRVLSAVHVPELNLAQFVRDALHHSCYLTLYAYVLQRLPTSQSLTDELETLNQLIEWNSSARPSSSNEAKLFLWWQKMLELCLRQIDFGAEQRGVLRALLTLVPTLVLLGEDKSSAGLLGAIGLGRRSQLSLRFRLVSKTLAAYLSAQMPNDASLRLSADAPGAIVATSPPSSPVRSPPTPTAVSSSQQARQAFAQLESLRTNKQYAMLKQSVETAIEFVASPWHSLRDSLTILAKIVSDLYPEFNYVEVVRRVRA